MRPTKLGAKNRIFVGGKETGLSSAIIDTMIENIRKVGVDPSAYLREVFERLPAKTIMTIFARFCQATGRRVGHFRPRRRSLSDMINAW